MDSVANPSLSLKRNFALRYAFSIALLAMVFCATAHAEDIDPFQTDKTQWMSFDRYKDQVKHGGSYEPQAAVQPEVKAPDTDAHFLDDSKNTTVAGTPAVAQPTRALNPPIMPGMNRGYEINVSTTEDDKPPIMQVTHMESEPSIQMKKNWETTKEAMQHLAQSKKTGSDDDDADNNSLDVRMSFLPSSKITPIPDPATPHHQGRAPAVMAAAAAKAAADPNSADYAAWASAIEAYKKRQLAAIQGDRATLVALQAAIAELGLQKQLDFMPGSNSNISVEASTAPTNMDMPAPSLTALTKN